MPSVRIPTSSSLRDASFLQSHLGPWRPTRQPPARYTDIAYMVHGVTGLSCRAMPCPAILEQARPQLCQKSNVHAYGRPSTFLVSWCRYPTSTSSCMRTLYRLWPSFIHAALRPSSVPPSPTKRQLSHSTLMHDDDRNRNHDLTSI